MPVLERNFLIRCTSSNEWIVVRKSYSHDVALFLIVDSERRFLFERRIRPGDPLFCQIVIKAMKAKDPGECKFPLWAACRECLEEVNTYAEITAPPPSKPLI